MKHVLNSVLLFVAAAAALATCASPPPTPDAPLFSFGVIADVQYADKAPLSRRDYRGSLARLEAATRDLNRRNVDFVVQLGDLIDEGAENLDPALSLFNQLRVPGYHVLGNHDFCMSRATLLKRLGLDQAYYDFEHRGWRFLVLDGMDVSLAGGWPEESPNREAGRRMHRALTAAGERNAAEWNGGIGSRQLEWLSRALQAASERGERAVVLCHFPALAASSTQEHLLWNHREVRKVIEAGEAAVLYLNGHDHNGGYATENGVHYVTLPGMVESGADNAYAVIEVYENRLELIGAGTVTTRHLPLRR